MKALQSKISCRRPREVINLVIENNTLSPEKIVALKTLQSAVKNNGPIELVSGGDDAHEWNILLRWDQSQTWLDHFHHGIRISYFHRLLLEKIGYFREFKDPYARLKAEGLRAVLTKMKEHAWASIDFDHLLYHMLWGNKFDLVPPEISGDTIMLRDDRQSFRAFAEHELTEGSRIDILADNAGEELFYDLLFARHLIMNRRAGEVRVHVKNYPYNVSDATREDADNLVSTLKTFENRSDLQHLGQELERIRGDGKLTVITYPFTTLGIDRAKAMNVVHAQYDGASLIVSKGDFNYRKHVGWYYWSIDDDLMHIISYLPCPALVLRATKNEILTGATRNDLLSQLDGRDSVWWKKGVGGMIIFERPDASVRHQFSEELRPYWANDLQ